MRRIGFAVLALALATLGGCDQAFLRGSSPGATAPIAYGPETERQIEKSMQRYGTLLLSMDASGVSNMYAPDGIWERTSGPLTGRDAIRNALANSNGVIVQAVDIKTSYISYNGPAVVQTGDITQTVKLPNGKTVSSAARFEATWIKSMTGEWWIKRMSTRPNAKASGT